MLAKTTTPKQRYWLIYVKAADYATKKISASRALTSGILN